MTVKCEQNILIDEQNFLINIRLAAKPHCVSFHPFSTSILVIANCTDIFTYGRMHILYIMLYTLRLRVRCQVECVPVPAVQPISANPCVCMIITII